MPTYVLKDKLLAAQAEVSKLKSDKERLLMNYRSGWEAMALIRQTSEELGPVGCIRSSEHVCCAVAPTFDAEAQELVSGIMKIASASNT